MDVYIQRGHFEQETYLYQSNNFDTWKVGEQRLFSKEFGGAGNAYLSIYFRLDIEEYYMKKQNYGFTDLLADLGGL